MLKGRAGIFRNQIQEKEKNATHPLAPGQKEGIKYVSFDFFHFFSRSFDL